MKKLILCGLKILLIFVSISFFTTLNLFADEVVEQKKEGILNFKILGALSIDQQFVNNNDVGFWGFSDINNIEKQIFGGYLFGMVIGYRFVKNFDIFLDISVLRSKILMGKAGDTLKGIAIWDADPNHTSSISPQLTNDIYYISKATMGRIGARFVYPINDIIEPNVGLAVGLVPYEIAFGNEDGSRAYSEVLSDILPIYAFIIGIDFNIYAGKENLMTIGLFFEINGSATEAGTKMSNWIWQGWTYHAQFPVVPAFRYGLSLGFNF
ncbi:MAG: hypothetical protein ACP5KI_02975 [Brevinematia bacterium]